MLQMPAQAVATGATPRWYQPLSVARDYDPDVAAFCSCSFENARRTPSVSAYRLKPQTAQRP
jgi:hypothetical protein